MVKLITGAIVGGIILFLWGWLSWSAIPLHSASIHYINNEESVITAMNVAMDKKGVYIFPGMPSSSDPAAMEEWTQKYQRGPIGMIIYDPEGSEPVVPARMILGFILGVISCFVASWFLSRSTAAASSYLARVTFCGMLGIFISLTAHLVNWNWMGYPLDYTLSWVMDAVAGWLLAGLGIAAFVKMPKAPVTAA